MRRNTRLGLDELMIVNPGPNSGDAYLLGDDNRLYRIGATAKNIRHGRFFLGDDGSLYEIMIPSRARNTGRFTR